jgi:hypothetical protein
MPLLMDLKLERLNSNVRHIYTLRDLPTNVMACWYSGLYENKQPNSQPYTKVHFRQLDSQNQLSDLIITRNVPITELGQLRIGSVWSGQRAVMQANFQVKTFDVAFLKGQWFFNSFQQATTNGRSPPFPFELYPLKYEHDRNNLLQFKLPTGGFLIVPCLEFFTRCYGRSAELRRVLATYPWDTPNGGEKRLLKPIEESEESDKYWKVRIGANLVNGDAVFLAHVKYDDYTRWNAKQIRSSLMINFANAPNEPAFLRIGPWFQGEAKLKVRGIPFDNGKSFLGLQLIGATDPDGSLIENIKDNRSNAETPADLDSPGNAWKGMPGQAVRPRPEIIDLTNYETPDNGQSSIEIDDPDFEILGIPRAVRNYKDKQAKDRGATKPPATHPDSFSQEETHGDGKGMGRASTQAHTFLESQGVLRDMWNAMLYLANKHPEKIKCVEWFTLSKSFCSDTEPQLVPVDIPNDTHVTNGQELPTDIRHWAYLDIATKQIARGLLVTRITCVDKQVYIIEIQRRPCRRKTGAGSVVDSEEPFKGFVFTLDNPEDITKWVRTFQLAVCHVKGVVQKLIKSCPGMANAFVHKSSVNDEVKCESAVKNALEKMGIDLN